MDLILRNALLADGAAVDLGVAGGKVAVLAARLAASGEALDLGGRLVVPGFVETHLHLDKSCILDRCHSTHGTLEEAIAEVSRVKREFTPDDVFERASRTLEKSIVQGTTHIRTHVEVDPGIGLRGFEGIQRAAEAYRWAVDVEICVFPQEGLTNNPGTEELMREALALGANAVGAAPYTDPDPHQQIERVFKMARDFDVDIDMHLDLGDSPERMDVEYVCEMTERHRYGGRVAIGHVTKLSLVSAERFEHLARRLADAGVAVTVLPSTDLFLMGRGQGQGQGQGKQGAGVRGVLAAHELVQRGVNCSLSTNNVLNPFTPMGDCSLLRMANLYANCCHVGTREGMRGCLDMITSRSAKLLRLGEYGVEVGNTADLVVLDCTTPEQSVAELAIPLCGFKRGRKTFTRALAQLHRPQA